MYPSSPRYPRHSYPHRRPPNRREPYRCRETQHRPPSARVGWSRWKQSWCRRCRQRWNFPLPRRSPPGSRPPQTHPRQLSQRRRPLPRRARRRARSPRESPPHRRRAPVTESGSPRPWLQPRPRPQRPPQPSAHRRHRPIRRPWQCLLPHPWPGRPAGRRMRPHPEAAPTAAGARPGRSTVPAAGRRRDGGIRPGGRCRRHRIASRRQGAAGRSVVRRFVRGRFSAGLDLDIAQRLGKILTIAVGL